MNNASNKLSDMPKGLSAIIDAVLKQIKEDESNEDETAIAELLGKVPVQYLLGYLHEEDSAKLVKKYNKKTYIVSYMNYQTGLEQTFIDLTERQANNPKITVRESFNEEYDPDAGESVEVMEM